MSDRSPTITPPPRTHKRKKSGPRPGQLNCLLPLPEPELERPQSPMMALRTQLASLEGGTEEHAKLEEFMANKSKLLGDLREDSFEKLSLIYSGEGRTVHKVVHRASGLVTCRKAIHIDANPTTQQAIVRELGVLHECHCRDIVCYYGCYFGSEEQDVNILMEFMDGGCLEDLQRRFGRISETILSYACHRILRALQYLDSKHSIIHRDVKPSNVLVNTAGEIKLCDFGVSRKLLSTRANTFVGTMRYMSPERIQGQAYNVKSDIWSLGLALIEMATGHYPLPPPPSDVPLVLPLRNPVVDPPLQGGAAKHKGSKMAIFDMVAMVVKGEPPSLPGGYFTPEFEDFVHKCLIKATEERADLNGLLSHPWITNCTTTQEDVATYVQKSLGPKKPSRSSVTPSPANVPGVPSPLSPRGSRTQAKGSGAGLGLFESLSLAPPAASAAAAAGAEEMKEVVKPTPTGRVVVL